tara:strand:+ start:34873 stop:35742 length:870 start_codon:yes stop_codon:yes gene_type:complete
MDKKIITALFISTMILTSCGEDSTQQVSQEEQAQDDLLNEMAEEGEDKEPEAFYLPSALQIGSIFQKSGLSYIERLTNSPSNQEQYITKSQKILNFGVYSADLAYIILNGQSQDATAYLKTIKSLSDKIGFGAVFESEELLNRFQNSLGNEDSILNVMIDIQMQTDMFVDENNLQEVTHIIFAGAWIEGMYLGVKASNSNNQHMISGRLVEQMTVLDNLVKALRSNNNQTEDIEQLTKDLNKLDKFFIRLEENKNSQKIASFKDYKISKEHLEELSIMIIELRNRITKV